MVAELASLVDPEWELDVKYRYSLRLCPFPNSFLESLSIKATSRFVVCWNVTHP
jgi:hypothetical protein